MTSRMNTSVAQIVARREGITVSQAVQKAIAKRESSKTSKKASPPKKVKAEPETDKVEASAELEADKADA